MTPDAPDAQAPVVTRRSSVARLRRSPRGFHVGSCSGFDAEVGEEVGDALHDRELEPGEVGTETEVAAVAERDVPVRVPVEDAPVGIRKRARVVVRRPVGKQDDVAGRDGLAVELEVVRRVAAEDLDRRDVAEELVDRGVRESRGVGEEPGALLGMPREVQQAHAHRP